MQKEVVKKLRHFILKKENEFSGFLHSNFFLSHIAESKQRKTIIDNKNLKQVFFLLGIKSKVSKTK